jgi:hypothetical protein
MAGGFGNAIEVPIFQPRKPRIHHGCSSARSREAQKARPREGADGNRIIRASPAATNVKAG